LANEEKQRAIIRGAIEEKTEQFGVVRIAWKSDVIWMKQKRNSKQDIADIEALQNEQN